MNKRIGYSLLTAILVEGVYTLATRITLQYFHTFSREAELIRTPLRLIAAAVFWYLFKDRINPNRRTKTGVNNPFVIGGILCLMLTPILIGTSVGWGPWTKALFAFTSIAVALNEEFFFRGIIQNLLQEKLGMIKAILISNVFFMIWHFGALPFDAFTCAELLMVGMVFGFLYAITQDIWMVVILHAVYDAVWSASPLIPNPLPLSYGYMTLGMSVLLIGYWAIFRVRHDND